MYDNLTHDSSILYKPFDINEHLKAFGDTYLEAVILEDGTVEYCIPSHQEKLIEVISRKTGRTRDDIIWNISEEDKLNWGEYLQKESGCISLWAEFYIGIPNEAQQKTIEWLKENGAVKLPYTQYENIW